MTEGDSANAFESELLGTAGRDRAEANIEALRERGGVFVEAVRATRIAMVLTDPNEPENPIVFANQSFLNLSGYAMDEVLGQQPYFMNGPDTDPLDVARFRQAIDQDRDEVLETVQHRKDGSRFVASLFLSAFKDDDGRTLHHFLSWVEVTDRVAAEDKADALVESEDGQAFLLKLSDALRAQTDSNAVVHLAITMLGEKLGLDRCYATAMYPAEDRTDVIDEVRRPGLTPMPSLLRFSDFPEAGARTFDGTLIFDDTANHPALTDTDKRSLAAMSFGALLSSPVRRGPRTPIWSLGAVSSKPRRWTAAEIALVEEVTERTWAAAERVRVEVALRESEAKYRTLFETMGQGYALVELIRDQSGKAVDQRYLEFNPASERLLGIKAAEATGKLASEVFPALQPEWTATFEQVVRDGTPQRVEHLVAPLNRWFEVYAYPAGRDRFVTLYEDVTDRKHAELALRDSEERFRTLAESIDDVFYITDLDSNRLIYLSAAYETVWGRPAAQLEYDLDSFIDTIHPDDRDQFFVAKAAQIRGEAVANEYRIVRPDGQVRWIYDRSFPISDREGARRSAGVASDSTERRLAIEAQRESEHRLRLIVESAQDYAIFTTDADDVIDEWMPGAAVVFGFTKEEAEGQPGAIIFTPNDRAGGEPQKEIDTAVREGKAANVRWHIRKDGELVFIEGQVVPLRGPAGEVRGFLKIGQDVTERRLAEQALRESEERFRQFGEASSDLLWIRDAKTLAFEYLSPAFEQLYGVPREQVLRANDVKQWAELIHPDDRDIGVDVLRKLRLGVPCDSEFRVVCPDGSIRWLHDTSFPLRDQSGRVVRIAGIAQDVTERKRAVELQGTLLAELQHRVRNILALIQSVVRRTVDTSESPEEYASHLSGRIAAMARTQAMLTRSPARRVNLEEVLRDELLCVVANENQHWCEGPEVLLSPKAAEVFTLAVHELATNAVKYGALSQPSGQLEIRWDLVEREDQQWLVFEWEESRVRHNGFSREGFGTELITRRVPYELKGEGSMEPADDGMLAKIAFPLVRSNSILETNMPEQLQ